MAGRPRRCTLNISNVTVTVNGGQCVLTPVPYNQTMEARWSYNGPRIATPVGACQWPLTFAAYYNGQLMRDNGQPTYNTFTINIYGISCPAYPAADVVNIGPAGNCVFNSQNLVLSGSYAPTRDLRVTATVVPPAGLSGVNTITIGIIQTLTLYGDVSCGQIPALQLPCSVHLPTPSTPIWDGVSDALACYYSANCVWTSPAMPWPQPCNSSELAVSDWHKRLRSKRWRR